MQREGTSQSLLPLTLIRPESTNRFLVFRNNSYPIKDTIGMKQSTLNPLEALLYKDKSTVQDTFRPQAGHPYAKGMAVTINNHKQDTADLVSSLKRVYQSLVYGLTGKNPSRESLMLKTKVPPRKKVMDLVASKTPLLVAGIHSYDYRDNRTGRGSYANYGYQHLHLYCYGVHHYFPSDEVASTQEHLRKLLQRYLHSPKKAPKTAIEVKPVGMGKYLYECDVTPTSLYDYLLMPTTSPNGTSWINYIAGSKEKPQDRTPLLFIYKENT